MSEFRLVEQLKGVRVAVIGDVMLDVHVYGRVGRISNEAPVPVLHVAEERLMLGGAANVAANIAALGGAPRLLGLVGEDAAAKTLVGLIDQAEPGILARLSTDRERPTVVKTRYLGGHQQIVRVDRERIAPAPAAVEDILIEEIEEAAASCAVLIASDYGKGVLTDRVLAALMAAAKKHNRPVIVDPKRSDYSAYRGAAFITPNRQELTGAVGLPCESEAEAASAAEAAIEVSGAAILLTRSEKGMALYRSGQPPAMLPAETREVFDVSGAGDTVIGVFGLALAAGAPAEQAVRLANAAAGIVVEKLGTAIATPEELSAALGGRSALDRGAALAGPASLDEAQTQRLKWRMQGLSVGFTNGCFDLIHPGHVSLIAQAAAACDRLIVALNTDESVRRLKGDSRPIQPLEARAAVIGAMRGVDLVVGFAEDTPLDLLKALEPDLLVKGADYAESEVVGADLVRARGGEVLLAKLTAGESTTSIVARAGPGLREAS